MAVTAVAHYLCESLVLSLASLIDTPRCFEVKSVAVLVWCSWPSPPPASRLPQIPLFETRSDGRDNFIGSLIMAGSYSIPEVAVFFNNKMYRGNRTTKVSTGSLQVTTRHKTEQNRTEPNLTTTDVQGEQNKREPNLT